MKRAARSLGTLLLITSLLTLLPTRGLLLAAGSFQTIFSGRATLDGPIRLELTVNPPVTSPGQTIQLELRATNKQNTTASPQIELTLPAALTPAPATLPAGTNLNLQSNTISWLPLLEPNGGTRRLNLTLTAAVADLTRPEQQIEVTLQTASQTESTTLPIWIGLPPQARITAEPAVAAVGQPIQLTADTDGTGPFIQTWDFGDGRRITTPNPQIVYATAGTYQVTLDLANPLTETRATTTITVVPQPAADFTIDDEKPVPFQSVRFTNRSGGQQPLTYLWEFGDGTTSTERDPVHQFPATGYFQVRLLVTSPAGQAETTHTIVVGNPPSADFLIPADAVTGQPVTAEAFFDGTVTTLRWDMGDGTTYTGETVSHTYTRVGAFPITLTAANDYGEITVSKSIQIGPGSFESYLPAVRTATPLAAIPPAAPDLGTGIAGQPGGAGPGQEEGLPTPVIPEIPVTIPPEAQTPPVTDPAATPFEPVVLPPQTPLPPEATPAEALLWYINEARRLHNLPPLEYSYELSIAAQLHTEDILTVPGLKHSGSDGSRPPERQARAGFPGYYGGEAVAWGWESPVPVVEFWVNSPAHRVLILNPNITHVGVGYAADARAENIWYWTAEFGLMLNDPNQPPNPL